MNPLRIMIVEDDDAVRELLETVLQVDYEVLAAHNGLMGLNKLERVEPDIVICDVAMPVMNGWEFVQRLRQKAAFKNTLVIFLSAISGKENIKAGYEYGADLYLTKPIVPDRFLRMLDLQIKDRGMEPRPKKNSMEELTQSFALQESRQRSAVEGRPRVLVVDDDKDALVLMRMTLEQHYEVVTARDGLEAIDMALQWQPDVFIIDWMMPKINGVKLAQILRRSDDFKNLAIIFVSARDSEQDRKTVKDLNISDYIGKPFTPSKLTRTVDTVVSSSDFVYNPKRAIADRFESDGEKIVDPELEQKMKWQN